MEGKDGISDYMNKIRKLYSKSDKDNFNSWVIRVTNNDSEAPPPKLVRRIINSLIRDSKVDPMRMIDIVESESNLINDSRTISKLFYLILLSTQYRNFTFEFETITQKISYISNDCVMSDSDPEEGEFQMTANSLLQTLMSKQTFHLKHPEIHGNFYMDPNTVSSPTLINDLIIHLEIVVSIVSSYIARFPTPYKSILIMLLPIVDELVNVYELTVRSSPEAKGNQSVIKAEELIERSRSIDIIKSSVIFPHPTVVAPRMRYPFMK